MYIIKKNEELEKEATNRDLTISYDSDGSIILGNQKFSIQDDPSMFKIDEHGLAMFYIENPVISHIPNAKKIQERFKDYDFENATEKSIDEDIKILQSYHKEKEFIKCLILMLLDSVTHQDSYALTPQTKFVLVRIIKDGGMIRELADEIVSDVYFD